MKIRIKRGPSLRIRVKELALAAFDRVADAGEFAVKHGAKAEGALLVYLLVLLVGWCTVRLGYAGLPLDTGWQRADWRYPHASGKNHLSISRSFRAIRPPSILVDAGDRAMQSE